MKILLPFITICLNCFFVIMFCSPVPAMANGPSGVVAETFSAPPRKAANQPQENSSVGSSEFGSAPSPVNTISKPTIAFGSGDMSGQPATSSSDCSMSTTPAPAPALASSSAICFSSSDPVLVPSIDSRLVSPLDTIKHESDRASTEPNAVIPTENKLASGQDFETIISFRSLSFFVDINLIGFFPIYL